MVTTDHSQKPFSKEEQQLLVDALVDRAQAAAKNARSYRDFKVGCALQGVYYSDHLKISVPKVYTGANLKPVQGGPKICAEQGAIASAIADGCTHITAIAVAGDPLNERDPVSGKTPETLHPCPTCRALMAGLPEIISKETLIILAPNGGQPKVMTFGELLEYHAPPKVEPTVWNTGTGSGYVFDTRGTRCQAPK